MSAHTHTVWLGHRASIWSHRGYTVRGDTVYTESAKDAHRVARESLPDDVVTVEVDDGTYYYTTQGAADSDGTGAQADAVVSRYDDSGDDL